MAGASGLLRKIPAEVLVALLSGGTAALASEEGEDPLARGLSAGAVTGAGTHIGKRALRGMFGRIPVASQKQLMDKAIQLRGSMGQKGSARTQFPPKRFTQQLNEYADMKRGRDRLDGIGKFIGEHPGVVAGPVNLGILGGVMAGGGALYEADKQNKTYEEFGIPALEALGHQPNVMGIISFQAENAAEYGLVPTGKMDEKTFQAIALKLRELQQQEDGIPDAPSLKPPAPEGY